MRITFRQAAIVAGGVGMFGLVAFTLSLVSSQRVQLSALSTQLAIQAFPSATNASLNPIGCLRVETLGLRAGPGAGFPVIGELKAGDCVPVDGRSPDEVWVRSPEGWLAAASLDLSVPLTSLPLLAIPATLTPVVVLPTPTLFAEAPPTKTQLASAGCPQGCTEHVPGCDIKGNISSNGEKIYHVPGGEFYDATLISPEAGERWFCTEEDAVANGWRRSMR